MIAGKVHELLARVQIIGDKISYDHQVETLCNPRHPYVLSFINQHGFNLAHTDERFRHALLESNCVLRDGVGLELALRLLGHKVGVNCNGSDLIPKVLQKMEGRTGALFGTKDPWLTKACLQVESVGIRVVSKLDGFCDTQSYISAARTTAPEIIILGMGMPRQEEVAIELARHCDHACLIVNGGAIIDFLAGRFVRAPKWIQNLRLEWLFRLLLEPKRLFRRYVAGGAVFAARIIKLAWHVRCSRIQFQSETKE